MEYFAMIVLVLIFATGYIVVLNKSINNNNNKK